MTTVDSLSMPAVHGAPRCVWDAAAALGEGTCWSPGLQALWWLDILGRQLHFFRPADGARQSWPFDTEISAVAERANGPGLAITLRGGLALFDPESPQTPPRFLSQPANEPSTNRFNDGKCDRRGRFWGGTMDFDCVATTGALYRFDADGGIGARYPVGFAVTNGPTWSADERTMFFNETVRGRVYAFDFDAEYGTLSNQREWLRFAKGDGLPDGMTTDAAGRVWIAHWGGSCVSCHDPASGAELGRITLPVTQVTNVCFGGPTSKTLFITSARTGLDAEALAREPLAGGLFAVDLDATGVAPNLFAG